MGTSHAFEPPAAGACDQCCQTNTRQTTHHQEVQVSTVVRRKRHPFEGCRLSVIRSLTRRGVLDLLVILPDGSRTLIPAAWTTGITARTPGRSRPAAMTPTPPIFARS